jgi:hypothetical protein
VRESLWRHQCDRHPFVFGRAVDDREMIVQILFLDGLMADETAAMVLLERSGRAGTGTPRVTLESTILAVLPTSPPG